MSVSSKQKVILVAIIGILGGVISIDALYMTAKAQLAQHLLEQAWKKSSQEGNAIAPWPWADTKPIAKIRFVAQQQSYIVMQGSSGRTLAFAPGHLSGSTMPGEVGHTIISAHRDTHFSVLERVKIDDLLTVETINNELHSYKIQSISIVDSRTEPLYLEPDKGLLTLITCYPFDALTAGSPYRYRVDASITPSI